MFKKIFQSLMMAMLYAASSASAHAFQYKGEVIQGGLLIAQTQPGTSVTVDGESVRVSKEGFFLVGFNRDHPEESVLKLVYPDRTSEVHKFDVARREYNIQRIEGIAKKYVSPPESTLKRIRNDNRQIGGARRHDDARTDFLQTFIWPAYGPISGVYGSQRYFNGKPRRPHFGLDIAAPTGTPVVAPAAGIIRLAHPDMYYSGGTLILDHGHGLTSTFIHMDTVTAKTGTYVKQGDPLGTIGATGRATGPHLDWRINLFKLRLDPAFLVPPMPEQ